MRAMSWFDERRALALTLCWLLLLALTGSTDVLLFLAPALLIAIPLFCGRYLGEELIAELGTRWAKERRRPRPARSLCPPLRTPRTWRPHGASPIAFSLAKRPPPAALLAQI
jgi:hypothetical protein